MTLPKSTAEHHSFDVNLAAKYGVYEAIIIHHFQHWINHNKRLGRNFKEGRTWSYQTRAEIAAWFPYLSPNQVRRLTDRLVELKVLRKGNYNKMSLDKTIWYAFENEEMFTIGNFAKSIDESATSSGKSANPVGRFAKAIPESKTDSKPDTKRDNVSTVSSFQSKKKKDFSKTLNLEQKAAFDKVMAHKPDWGEPLDPNTVCAWFKARGWSPNRVIEALEVYRQDVAEAKRRGDTVRSMGAAMCAILKNGRKPIRNDAKNNKAFAERKAKEHRFLEITKRYVKVSLGKVSQELCFNLPEPTFVTTLESFIMKSQLEEVYS